MTADELQDRIDRTIWTAVVGCLEGDTARATQLMAEAVALAEPDGNVEPFLAAGADAATLLRAIERAHTSRFLRKLTDPALAQGVLRRTFTPLVEQLSDRELGVLGYLPRRMSNAEIASQLYISLNTMKSHLKSIYRKLEVTSRSQAVEAAERYGLL